MFIELVDDLRCPRPHEESWLVASADRAHDRHIIEGMLGCPVCHAEYPIRDGAVWFTPPSAPSGDRGPAGLDRITPGATGTRHAEAAVSGLDAEDALRLAAFLDLTDESGLALLTGSWGSAAPLLRDVVPAHLVVLNPQPPVRAESGVSVLHAATAIPLAGATCRGVALDSLHAHPPWIAAAVRVLRPRGRLVAPESAPLPSDVKELARDERLWIAVRDQAPSGLVALRRAPEQ